MYPFKIIMILISVVFPVVFAAFTTEYIKYKYSRSSDKKNFYNPLRYKSLISIVLIASFSYLFVNHIKPDKKFDTVTEKILHGKKRNVPKIVKEGYGELIKNDFYNIDYHYSYIKWHYKQKKKYKESNIIVFRRDKEIRKVYRLRMLNNNDSISNIGTIGYASCLYFEGKYSDAIWVLKNSEIPDKKYYKYIIGKSYSALNFDELAEKYLLQESLNKSGYLDGAIKSLISLYIKEKKYKKAVQLAHNKRFEKHIPPTTKKVLAVANNDKLEFVKSFLKIVDRYTDLITILAALLISIIWLFYLRLVDIFEKEKWYTLFICFLAGFILAPVSNYLVTYIRYYYDFYYNSQILNDLSYSVFVIGGFEEALKIIPLLLIMFFSKEMNEPYDYILFASISALGFSFFENIIYFNTTQLHIMHGRALISVIGHMFNSSVIAYGIVLARYKFKKKMILYFILSFLIAISIHGIYNFLLKYNLQIVFLIVYLLIVKVWVTIINNSLNNSDFFNYNVKIKTDRLQYYLVVSLTTILAFEYISLSVIYGASAANNTLLDSTPMGLVLILFLSSRLSKFDLIKRNWNIFDYRINPFVFRNYPLNFVGYNIYITPYNTAKINELDVEIPINGNIINRVTVLNTAIWEFKSTKKEKNWFLIKIDKEIGLKNFHQKYVLIKFRSKQPSPEKEMDLMAKLLVINKRIPLSTNNFERSDLKLFGAVVVNLKQS